MKPSRPQRKMLKLGILGGGQLARMLALEGHDLGLEIHILSEKQEDPAAQVCRHWLQGDPNSKKDIIEFSKDLNVVTFESEFVNCALLGEILKKKFVFPSLEAMGQLQDRAQQKTLLVSHRIPTSEFKVIEKAQDLEELWRNWGPVVIKKTRGGYDGYGTYYLRAEEDLKKLQVIFPGHFIAEKFVKFKRELAISAVRSRSGEIVFLPLVETKQTQSRCDWVVGPVKHPGLTKLQTQIKSFLNKLDYVGIIAFELFDVGAKLLVNEIAPRVHNSGHYSQQALNQSQFLLHLKAGLDMKLGPLKLLGKNFCMVNLLGTQEQDVAFPADWQGQLHWYGKKANRAGRKMGHINFLGSSPKALLKLALNERKKFSL